MEDKDNSPVKPLWAFDTSSQSEIGAELEKSRRIHERNANPERMKKIYTGWSIGKTDPNERFTKTNIGQFGTRQRRK